MSYEGTFVAFEMELPEWLREQGWKVKIRDKERVEPPHVTVLKGKLSWRWGIRERAFLDKEPDPSGVNPEIVRYLNQAANAERLSRKWNEMYPENPV